MNLEETNHEKQIILLKYPRNSEGAPVADMSISTPDQLDTWLLTDYVTTQKGNKS